MSGAGRRAVQPPPGWQPPARRDGCLVEFVSEDGRQRKVFDFATLPGRQQIREELAVAFAEATGPLGTWKRESSANGLWTVARKSSRWLADSRPGLVGLAHLTAADARLLLYSMRLPNGDLPIGVARALFGYSPVASDAVRQELARHRSRQRQTSRQPYTSREVRWITIAARAVVRRARARLDTHWRLVEDLRAGRFNQCGPRDPQRCLAEALEHCARMGDSPPSMDVTRTVAVADVKSLAALLHLTAGEAWAFAVLLAGLTGLNSSTLYALPAPHMRANGPDEPGIAFVNAVKPRRGPRSAMTLPLTALPTELQPAGGDNRSQRLLNTSLATAFGVYTLLIRLTEPARLQLRSDRAFVHCTGMSAELKLAEGAPRTSPELRRKWLSEVMAGEPERDQVLLGISLDRLRKTYLEQHRRPVAHTPATLRRYLRRMRTVTEDGFHIVREALDEQVSAALARRRMSVEGTVDDAATSDGQDTVLGSCRDFQHSPLDGGRSCRQTFLTCLDCGNARAFPRHLPLQLVVLDALRAQRPGVPVERWITDFAGRVAQLEEIVGEFEPAQREQARSQITDSHRHLVSRLWSGDLDPT